MALSALMIIVTATTISGPFIWGSDTRQNACHALAPSMAAASSTSSGSAL